jgi:CxxC motif-containing protein (DUF1111 family)
MKFLLASILCLAVPVTSFAADNTYKVIYDGGSVPELKAGVKTHLSVDSTAIKLTDGKKEIISIAPAAVTDLSYGQDVHRRIGTAIGLAVISLGIGALMAFSKSKKHFIGLTFADGDKKGGFAMQCDKNEYRGILAALEGVTGKKAVDSDAMSVKN